MILRLTADNGDLIYECKFVSKADLYSAVWFTNMEVAIRYDLAQYGQKHRAPAP